VAGKAAPADPAPVVVVVLAVATEISVECGVTRSGTAGGAGLSPSCPPPAELPSFMFETSEKNNNNQKGGVSSQYYFEMTAVGGKKKVARRAHVAMLQPWSELRTHLICTDAYDFTI